MFQTNKRKVLASVLFGGVDAWYEEWHGECKRALQEIAEGNRQTALRMAKTDEKIAEMRLRGGMKSDTWTGNQHKITFKITEIT